MLEILTVTKTTPISTITKMTNSLKLSSYTMEHVETQNTPERNVLMESMQQTGLFPGRTTQQDRTDLKYRNEQNNINENVQTSAQPLN